MRKNYLKSIVKIIPEGFAVEEYPGRPEVFVISRPGDGFASIDIGDRSYSPGWCVPKFSCTKIPTTYAGKGWLKKLVDEAVTLFNR